MPRFIKIMVGWFAAVVAGVSVFALILIVSGVGPGWPRRPRQTTATVVAINREIVNVKPPRYRYVATVRWTNEQGAVVQQRDAWGRVQPDLSEGATLPAVAFDETGDPKARLSPTRIGLGSVGDYWRRQGLWDWAVFWGPILALAPATTVACAIFRNRKTTQADPAA